MLVWLLACAPSVAETGGLASSEAVQESYFFPGELWGPLPFAREEKFTALAEAVAGSDVVVLRMPLDFQLGQVPVQPPLTVIRFEAIYLADARGEVPRLHAGYFVEFKAPATAVQGTVRVNLQRLEPPVIHGFEVSFR